MCYLEIQGSSALFPGRMPHHAASASFSSCLLIYWPQEQVLQNKEKINKEKAKPNTTVGIEH